MMDTALKQRMVGASVIIALAVIFIPMIFSDSLTTKNQSISIKIPDEPENLKHKVISLDVSRSNKNNDDNSEIENTVNHSNKDDAANIDPLKISKQETIIDIVDNSDANKSQDDAEKSTIKDTKEIIDQVIETPKIDPKEIVDKVIKDKVDELGKNGNQIAKDVIDKTVETTSKNFSYRVKYGAFSQQKNAQQLKAQIIHAGFEAIVEKDNSKGLYKVFSPLMDSNNEALEVSANIQKLKLNIGKINIEKLDEKSSESAESLMDTGWTVQIGSFSGKENAIKLRNKIRNKGFVTFVDEVENSKKQKRYRVRIGPFATRDESIIEQEEVLLKMNLKGLVKPHEKLKVVDQ